MFHVFAFPQGSMVGVTITIGLTGIQKVETLLCYNYEGGYLTTLLGGALGLNLANFFSSIPLMFVMFWKGIAVNFYVKKKLKLFDDAKKKLESEN